MSDKTPHPEVKPETHIVGAFTFQLWQGHHSEPYGDKAWYAHFHHNGQDWYWSDLCRRKDAIRNATDSFGLVIQLAK